MMSTKNRPGDFDCYANAHPDEPIFVLLGRSRLSAGLVRLWAILEQREGDHDQAKIAEALSCADAMDRWARELGKNPVQHRGAFEQIFIAATEGMSEHPEGFDDSCACNLCCSYQ